MLVNLKQRMQRAILILRDSSKDAEETLNAAYELRIAYAAMDAISGAIEAGKTAADDIDKHTS